MAILYEHCIVIYLNYSITKQRGEVIIEGTYDMNIGKNGELAHWQELEFNCKPGNVSRRPCVISPYHYRLDWLMWFAGFQVSRYSCILRYLL